MKYLALVLVVCLSGCGTLFGAPKIPPALLADCELVPPPDRELYISSEPDGREDLLFDTLKAQWQINAMCNMRLKTVREINNVHNN